MIQCLPQAKTRHMASTHIHTCMCRHAYIQVLRSHSNQFLAKNEVRWEMEYIGVKACSMYLQCTCQMYRCIWCINISALTTSFGNRSSWSTTRSTEWSCTTILNSCKVGTDIYKWKCVNIQHALQWTVCVIDVDTLAAISEQCMDEDIQYAHILLAEEWHNGEIFRTVINTGVKQSWELGRLWEPK
jgi:hypothetical protein